MLGGWLRTMVLPAAVYLDVHRWKVPPHDNEGSDNEGRFGKQ
jgi:hypothetical protein